MKMTSLRGLRSCLMSWPQVLIYNSKNMLIARTLSGAKLRLSSFLTFLRSTFPPHLASWGTTLAFLLRLSECSPPLVAPALNGRSTAYGGTSQGPEHWPGPESGPHVILGEPGNRSGPFDTSLMATRRPRETIYVNAWSTIKLVPGEGITIDRHTAINKNETCTC